METKIGLSTPPSSENSHNPNRLVLVGKLWWNANLPQQEHTDQCPEFLEGQDEKNIGILSTTDEENPRLSWTDSAHLVDTNRINHFHRMPSDLRRYIKYCYDLKQQYGSILLFIQHKRLNWPTIEPSRDAPFENESDYKILCNDWPYAIDQAIVHLVVWTKFTLEDDPRTGELTKEHKVLVERFIHSTFCESKQGYSVVNRNDLRWFKNWRSLRSVHALEHFHVMVYNPPHGFVQRITNGDIPMCERL